MVLYGGNNFEGGFMQKIYTLLTDEGTRFSALHGERDQLMTPAYADIRHAAAAHGWGEKFARENAANYVFDVRSEEIGRFEGVAARLEAGRTLSAEEAHIAHRMHGFMHATVAPHQGELRFLSKATQEHWVVEFGLRDREIHDWPVGDIIHDRCLWRAVHHPCHELAYPGLDDFGGPKIAPSASENIVAGRYLRCLAYACKLFGPERISPIRIVEAAAIRYRNTPRPSLIAGVIALLEIAGPDVLANLVLGSKKAEPIDGTES